MQKFSESLGGSEFSFYLCTMFCVMQRRGTDDLSRNKKKRYARLVTWNLGTFRHDKRTWWLPCVSVDYATSFVSGFLRPQVREVDTVPRFLHLIITALEGQKEQENEKNNETKNLINLGVAYSAIMQNACIRLHRYDYNHDWRIIYY